MYPMLFFIFLCGGFSLLFSETVSISKTSLKLKRLGENRAVELSQIARLKFADVDRGNGYHVPLRYLVVQPHDQGLQPTPSHLEPIFIRFGLFYQSQSLLENVVKSVEFANPNVQIDSAILKLL